jgi:hypothetical protein
MKTSLHANYNLVAIENIAVYLGRELRTPQLHIMRMEQNET